MTFNTLQARQAIRDVGRVMNIPARIVDELSKMLKNTPKITLMQRMLYFEKGFSRIKN